MSIYNLIDGESDISWKCFDIEKDDPSLNSQKESALKRKYNVDGLTLNKLFLDQYGLDYISKYFINEKKTARIVSYPRPTNTCYEKAVVLSGWNPLNIIKAFYLQRSDNGNLYALILPETGCFIDRNAVRSQINLPNDVELVRAKNLPSQMSYGSCSPFIKHEDIVENGGAIQAIVFDSEALKLKQQENTLDDFSFGLEHHVSVQMNYYSCYKMLKNIFPCVVMEENLLNLSFKERMVRKNGRIKIDYEFISLNYRTAQFINEIHGFGDVSISNDHVDELFIPDVLSSKAG